MVEHVVLAFEKILDPLVLGVVMASSDRQLGAAMKAVGLAK